MLYEVITCRTQIFVDPVYFDGDEQIIQEQIQKDLLSLLKVAIWSIAAVLPRLISGVFSA